MSPVACVKFHAGAGLGEPVALLARAKRRRAVISESTGQEELVEQIQRRLAKIGLGVNQALELICLQVGGNRVVQLVRGLAQ